MWDCLVNYYGYVISFVLILVYICVWLYNYRLRGVCKSKVSMCGKTVIITGADSGIGKATALDLAGRGAKVIMACVVLERAFKARDSIIKKTKNKNVIVKRIDLSCFVSVRSFAAEITELEPRLDVLVHNAGVLLPRKPTTESGLNTVLATNYFGPFLLTHLLIDLLKKTDKSRIIFVVSTAYKSAAAVVDPSNPNPTNSPSEKNFNFKMYSKSKFSSVLFTKELARRLDGTGVTVNCLHPGMVGTQIGASWLPPIICTLLATIIPFTRTATQGAQTSIYLAVSGEVEGVSGKYFSNCKEGQAGKETDNLELAKKYWEVSEKIVGLLPSDPLIEDFNIV